MSSSIFLCVWWLLLLEVELEVSYSSCCTKVAPRPQRNTSHWSSVKWQTTQIWQHECVCSTESLSLIDAINYLARHELVSWTNTNTHIINRRTVCLSVLQKAHLAGKHFMIWWKSHTHSVVAWGYTDRVQSQSHGGLDTNLKSLVEFH